MEACSSETSVGVTSQNSELPGQLINLRTWSNNMVRVRPVSHLGQRTGKVVVHGKKRPTCFFQIRDWHKSEILKRNYYYIQLPTIAMEKLD
jgi:hypothetical protein